VPLAVIIPLALPPLHGQTCCSSGDLRGPTSKSTKGGVSLHQGVVGHVMKHRFVECHRLCIVAYNNWTSEICKISPAENVTGQMENAPIQAYSVTHTGLPND
jgi:hypothetical protein